MTTSADTIRRVCNGPICKGSDQTFVKMDRVWHQSSNAWVNIWSCTGCENTNGKSNRPSVLELDSDYVMTSADLEWFEDVYRDLRG